MHKCSIFFFEINLIFSKKPLSIFWIFFTLCCVTSISSFTWVRLPLQTVIAQCFSLGRVSLSLPCPGDFSHAYHLRNDCNVEHNTTCFLCSLSHPRYSVHLGTWRNLMSPCIIMFVCALPPSQPTAPAPSRPHPFCLSSQRMGHFLYSINHDSLFLSTWTVLHNLRYCTTLKLYLYFTNCNVHTFHFLTHNWI